jgi:hypothetical protein
VWVAHDQDGKERLTRRSLNRADLAGHAFSHRLSHFIRAICQILVVQASAHSKMIEILKAKCL